MLTGVGHCIGTGNKTAPSEWNAVQYQKDFQSTQRLCVCLFFLPGHHHSFMVNVMWKNTLIFPLIVWISAISTHVRFFRPLFLSVCDSIEREKLCSCWWRWTGQDAVQWCQVDGGGMGVQWDAFPIPASGLQDLHCCSSSYRRLIKRLTQGISQFHNRWPDQQLYPPSQDIALHLLYLCCVPGWLTKSAIILGTPIYYRHLD